MKIRFYQYAENDFSCEVKKWYGWEPIYLYGGALGIIQYFPSKEDAIDQLRKGMKGNPFNVKIIECATFIVHKLK